MNSNIAPTESIIADNSADGAASVAVIAVSTAAISANSVGAAAPSAVSKKLTPAASNAASLLSAPRSAT